MKEVKKKKGSATLITILVTAVILTVAIGFNWYVREYLRFAEVVKKKSEAMLKAYSTFDIVNFLILTGTLTEREIKTPKLEGIFEKEILPINGESFKIIYDDIEISIQDSNGLISLQSIDEDALKRLIKNKGFDNPEAFIDRFYDWIDTDDLKRIFGAEKVDYIIEGYTPRNYPLQYKSELCLIKDFKDACKEIEPYLTLLPQSGFNPNTAPDDLLKAVLEIDDKDLQKIKDFLKIKPFQKDEELYATIGKIVVLAEDFSYKPSGFFEIKVKVMEGEDSIYSIYSGIVLRGNKYSPYIIPFWIEE
uniref:T2SS protein K first SAM-like domain-containing protein n=1 Tax=Thermodesulfobacterium geofontis TaxID=1295609 RepID=A0A7V6CE57_9BACT